MAEWGLNPEVLTAEYNPSHHAGLSVQITHFFIHSHTLVRRKRLMTPRATEKTELQELS